MAEEIITKDYGLPDTPFIQKLREQGQAKGRAQVVLRLLERKVGNLDAATVAQVQQLDADDLLALADALLDFTSAAALQQWLAAHAPAAADGA